MCVLKIFKGIQRGRLQMFGSGELTYHFTYIDDPVEGIILCADWLIARACR